MNPQAAGTVTVTNGAVPGSNTITFPNAGTFFWQAVYSGDANNSTASSTCASETLTVGKAAPSIATTLSATSISVGGTASDSATLTGATSTAGGTVTYTVYTNNTCTTGAQSAGTVTVTNGGVPGSNTLTFNTAGTFFWQAVYSGDANNATASSPCVSETLTIGKTTPSIATTLSASSITVGGTASDSATLSGVTSTAGGTVTYTVYTNNTCTTGATSAGTVTVTNGAVPGSNTLTFNTAGTFFWQAAYSGDANNATASSACSSEQLTVAKTAPSIATTLSATSITAGGTASDSAKLTGATSTAGGTVTYTAYSDSSCTMNPQAAGTVTVTNGVVPNSNSLTFNTAGTFYWQAAYSGDANNATISSTCASETLTVNQTAPTIATTLSASTIAVGGTDSDSAKLTGATLTAGGTVTYTAYSDNACSLNPQVAGTVTVTNDVVPNSNTLTFPAAGTFYWQAAYSGDANNKAAKSTCGSEVLTVSSVVTPTITTIASGVTLGGLVSDSATLSGTSSLTGKGTITFNLYGPSSSPNCTGTPVYKNTIIGINSTLPFSSGPYMPVTNSGGTFWWTASFSGDANNKPATSACGAANESVTVAASPGKVDKSNATCNGIYRGTSFTNNVVVPKGGICVLVNAKVAGNLMVSSGGALVEYGSAISGNLTSNGASWLDLRAGGFAQNLTVNGTTGTPPSSLGDGATANDICGTTVAQNLVVESSGTNAPFDIGATPDCSAPNKVGQGTTISGNAGHLAIGPASNGAGNSTAQDMSVQNNTGGGTLTSNSVQGSCTLSGNSPKIVGSGNTVGGTNLCNRTA
jgi:hypothetical protein